MTAPHWDRRYYIKQIDVDLIRRESERLFKVCVNTPDSEVSLKNIKDILDKLEVA
jgi:hypothetical protein